jgi:indole-3-glycerol phosphate synthase
MAATYLDRILEAHRRQAAGDHRDADQLLETARARPPGRGFAAALGVEGLSVIAEIKRRSPSKGDLAGGLVPALVARAYTDGGAAALSVLTDAEFFGGYAEDLGEARSACDLPILRKDFTVGPNDVCDAKLMGADAVLLIVSALGTTELAELVALASEIGLDSLVEAHDEAEAEKALDAGARVIGINQRDLVSFRVDTDRAVRVAGSLPAGVVKVAESGIRGPEDAKRLAGAGFDAILVGESLVTSADPAKAVAALRNF